MAFKDILNIRDENPEGVFKPKASLREFKELKKLGAFKDITKEWSEYLIQIRDMLENQKGDDDLRALDRLAGNAEAIRHLMETVDRFIIELELDEDAQNESEGGRNG